MNIVKIAILLVAGVSAYLLRRRLKVASTAPISDDECVSCGSGDVSVVGPGAYVCNACGYEGGSGTAATVDEKLRNEIANLEPQQRVARLEDHLVAAKRVLSACASEQPLTRNVDDVEQWQTSVSFKVAEGAAEIHKAAVITGGRTTLPNGFEIDPSAIEKSLLQANAGTDPREAQKVASEVVKFLDGALSKGE